MGDRSNCRIDDGESQVYLYTHWNGTELPMQVQKGLRRAYGGDRCDDGPYLARIIFDVMTETESDGALTGFGIAGVMQDNEGNRPIVVVDVGKQEVRYVRPETSTQMTDDVVESWSIKSFIAAADDKISFYRRG